MQVRKLLSPIAWVVFISCLLGQSSDGFSGTWKLRRSTGPGGEGIETINAIQNGLHFKHEWINPNGNKHFEEYSCIFDGKPHPMDREADAKHRKHTVVCRRLDDRTIEITVDHDEGVEVTKSRRVLARDGLTMQAIYNTSDDHPLIYDRQ